MRTPDLPAWIRGASVRGYVPAHRICTDETRLYGTESLYGDWNARVFLLAKCFGSVSLLRDRILAGDPRPYHHEPSRRGHRRLVDLAEPLSKHGLLYGSALANLLRDDGRSTGPLPNRVEALAHGACVTHFALEHLPRLRCVVCLGPEAWDVATRATGLAGDWAEHRDAGEPLGPLVAAYHPSARVPARAAAPPFELAARLLHRRAA